MIYRNVNWVNKPLSLDFRVKFFKLFLIEFEKPPNLNIRFNLE